MPKNTGIITDHEADSDKNDCLRWLMDTHSMQYSFYDQFCIKSEDKKILPKSMQNMEQYEHAMYILKTGLKRLFGVEVDYLGNDSNVPKYYRMKRNYLK